jgi:RND family efflux transporter MFP subunit
MHQTSKKLVMKYIYNFKMLVLLPASIILWACEDTHTRPEAKKENPIPVTVVTAEAHIDDCIHASGYIEANETAMISTRVMGFITDIPVNTGDIVQRGQLLATINNSDIQARRLQAAAMVAEVEAALEDARKDYERYTELYRQQSISTKELENATLHYTSVKAKAEATLQMQREAEATLRYTTLTAPFNGVVVQKNMDAGSMAQPGTPILILEQTGHYRVTASISDIYIRSIRKAMPAEIMVKSTGQSIHGKVSEVSPSSRFSGGQYIIKIDIPAVANHAIYSGMSVNVAIATGEHSISQERIITVPATAIIAQDQLTGIYALGQNNIALLRWVRVGKTTGDRVEIIAGIKTGEKIIIAGGERLYNGALVSIQ